jgi:hypothetical protein
MLSVKTWLDAYDLCFFPVVFLCVLLILSILFYLLNLLKMFFFHFCFDLSLLEYESDVVVKGQQEGGL